MYVLTQSDDRYAENVLSRQVRRRNCYDRMIHNQKMPNENVSFSRFFIILQFSFFFLRARIYNYNYFIRWFIVLICTYHLLVQLKLSCNWYIFNENSIHCNVARINNDIIRCNNFLLESSFPFFQKIISYFINNLWNNFITKYYNNNNNIPITKNKSTKYFINRFQQVSIFKFPTSCLP